MKEAFRESVETLIRKIGRIGRAWLKKKYTLSKKTKEEQHGQTEVWRRAVFASNDKQFFLCLVVRLRFRRVCSLKL